MSISAISDGASSVSTWHHHKEHKAPATGSVDSSTQDPALVSSATPSPADGAGGFGQLLDDMQALFSDYSSASGSAPASISNLGTAISSGGTLSATLVSDLSMIASDLTGIVNGQDSATSAPATVATAMQSIMPGDPSSDGVAATGSATDGLDRGVTGHSHHGRHGFQAVSAWPDLAMTQGTTLTSNATLGQSDATAASTG